MEITRKVKDPVFTEMYISLESKPIPRNEGYTPESNRVHIGSLSRGQAEQYGQLLKESVLEVWGRFQQKDKPADADD